MFNCCKKCCCQNNYNSEIIETLCNNVENTECNYGNMEDKCCCECGFDEKTNVFSLNPMLGQSYVPTQEMKETFTPCCGLKMGTIFPELVSPYVPYQSMSEIEYLRRTNKIGEGCNE